MHPTAILIMNLGSPESPTTRHLKPYLTEFLMDGRVMDVPRFFRALLVKGMIVPFRAVRSAAKYRSIWTEEGSPLVVHTRNLRHALQSRFFEPVYYCMRYGQPSTAEVLKTIHEQNPALSRLVLFPLYPHYAMSSYETAVEQVRQLHLTAKYGSTLKVVPPFYNHSGYIRALAASIRPYTSRPFDHLLFSYHGIPERHLLKTDPTQTHCLRVPGCCEVNSPAHRFCYRHHVIVTTELVAGELGLDKSQYSFSFQSRLGRDAWLKPFTATQLGQFPSKGIRNLLVACPAFISDCLETLEEIEKEGAEIFMNAGGMQFTMIPALNENPEWVGCAEELIRKQFTTS
ncbi:MAG TPA: ferrochelatase [Chitinophagaceae bacterium]|nr:ferrochelatase [Chitinophagaceae bacterium]